VSAERPHRENSGVLFANRRKTDNDNRPDWTGEAVIGPDRFYVSSWWKKDRNGKEFLSLSFRNANESEGRQ